MDRVLTTHAGSLIRPPELTNAFKLQLEGMEYDQEFFESFLASTVAEIVQLQIGAGLDIVDDGEMGKSGWIIYLYGRLKGVERRAIAVQEEELPGGLDAEAFRGSMLYDDYFTWTINDAEGMSWACTGPIGYDGRDIDRDVSNLSSALRGHEGVGAFLPVVAPGSIYWVKNEYYESDDEMMWAFAEALREEYLRIVGAGLVLQVDDATMWHKLATIKLQGGSDQDYRRWAEPRIEALNYALRGIPEDRVRYHVCSGSNHGPHTHDASLSEIIDLVLRVNAGYYLLEQANAAHEHEWRIWEEVSLPDDKILVPGVITHQTLMVEHPELVAQRIVRLAGLVGRDRVIAGADCGFAQSAPTQRVPEWTQWAKLRSLVEGARLASDVLWRRG